DTQGCRVYTYGDWSSGITIAAGGAYGKETALFTPGVYYVTNSDLWLKNNSCVRPALHQSSSGCTYCTQPDLPGVNIDGDGSGGTIFYFADGHTLNINGGTCGFRSSPDLIQPFPTVSEKCLPTSTIPNFVPASIADSV